MSLVRSLWWAARTGGRPPFDTAHLKVYYPATAHGDDAERLAGVFPPAPDGMPYPVVLFLSGINVGQDAYRRLACLLAAGGFAVVTFDQVAELFGGQYGLTPGVDVDAATPRTYGTRPTCPAIPALLDALARLNETGPLKGALDLDRVALGGHSAGGTVALQSARFFPQVKAVFAWGTHTMAATMLGWPAGTVLPAQVTCPVLLGAGGNDGVVDGSADRYGEDPATRRDPVTRTFEEALPESPGSVRGGDHLLAVYEGANHFAIADPVDPTVARAFLDGPASRDVLPQFGHLVMVFLGAHLSQDPGARAALDGFDGLRRR
ncbi:alpha/beta hydrolase [Microtetraspora sp. AC03309]|uniref:alpha/beta hydrolase family protein n=1 Tax=Microtetraspora sp. AC03309 TaxID=2779376 RepID=UPI001E2D74B3|nr:alpha/beta hydrolase [Microtetraspora sp. AC03309]MCC5578390.1 alpha/beta hydrolase [Microtetraspora sp. AC03309]